MDASTYSAFVRLRNEQRIEIRALRPEDRAGLIAAVQRSSVQSVYRRFFRVKRNFSEKEIDFFTRLDFVNHVALVAVVDEANVPSIAGGARYVVIEPGKAEVAFSIVDLYQGQGLGAALMSHLIGLARLAALKELVAEVLADNAAMLKLLNRCGLPASSTRSGRSVRVTLQVV